MCYWPLGIWQKPKSPANRTACDLFKSVILLYMRNCNKSSKPFCSSILVASSSDTQMAKCFCFCTSRSYFYIFQTNWIYPEMEKFNPSVPDAPWITFEKRFHENKTSENVAGSVKRSGVNISIINWSGNICRITRTLPCEIPNFTNFDFLTLRPDCARLMPALIYDRKMDARPSDTTHDILWWLSLVQSLFKGRNVPIWRKREPTQMKLSGTDRLNSYYLINPAAHQFRKPAYIA